MITDENHNYTISYYALTNNVVVDVLISLIVHTANLTS